MFPMRFSAVRGYARAKPEKERISPMKNTIITRRNFNLATAAADGTTQRFDELTEILSGKCGF